MPPFSFLWECFLVLFNFLLAIWTDIHSEIIQNFIKKLLETKIGNGGEAYEAKKMKNLEKIFHKPHSHVLLKAHLLYKVCGL